MSLSKSLIDSILPTSTDLCIDIADGLLEPVIDMAVLQNIPIVRSIYNLYKSAVSISDRLFLKKLIGFLSELNKIEASEISSFYEAIQTDEKFKRKLGDKLMFIIDKCEDDEKARMNAKIFGAYICKKIDRKDFFALSRAIDFLSKDDIDYLLTSKYWSFSSDANLITAGLLSQELTSGDERQDDLGFIIHLELSPRGRMLKTILSEFDSKH